MKYILLASVEHNLLMSQPKMQQTHQGEKNLMRIPGGILNLFCFVGIQPETLYYIM